MISIREVARLAEVSPATVSRVINGTANVAPEKRDRVMRVIEQTRFVPNETARTLFKKSSRIIGLIIPSIRNPYFTQLASYVDELATGRGYRVLLCNVGSDVEKEEAALQMLMSMNADGVIIASGNDGIRPALETCSIPVVALDAMFAGRGVAACVYCDHYSGGRMAMEHLLECGCRDIVCIQGPMAKYSARARYEGYRDVCREHGIAEQVVSCDYDFDAGIAMTETLLKNFSQVDGIIACNDMVAISTFKVLHKKNIPVPEKIQLIGFDDIYFSQLISPELSTIRQPIREMAEKAVELIMDDKDDEKKGGSFVLPTSLVIRETTKMRGRG